MTWVAAILVGLGGCAIVERVAPAKPKRQNPAVPKAPDVAESGHPIFDSLAYFFLGYWPVPYDK